MAAGGHPLATFGRFSGHSCGSAWLPPYHPEDAADLEEFLAAGIHLSISDEIVNKAIGLRQERKMALGDCLIASTALLHSLELVTRNTDDHKHISGLRMVNPFDYEP